MRAPGDAITIGWRERFDVIAAVRSPKRAVPGEPIGILARSLGGAATLLALPELDIDAVILESVYPTLDAAVNNRLPMRLGPIGPKLSPLLLMQLPPRLIETGVPPVSAKVCSYVPSARSINSSVPKSYAARYVTSSYLSG